ncbi:XdhC family protein [Epilithonimonas sp. UC225_85]|uniref:XdhC family protein n=1 Tax=Epilithonimonas sp. UC225_85 TaxID=3350167 RepID=UPI0036D356C7
MYKLEGNICDNFTFLMKEINEIIKAYKAVKLGNKKTALATVVHVEGSSYRRPGARMLVTEDGLITGAISGGCLEGDALKKALMAMYENKNKLVTYDTTNESNASFGVQLGCNGIVHILFEPIDDTLKINPIELLQKASGERKNAVLTTMFSLNRGNQPGTFLLLNDEGFVDNEGKIIDSSLKEKIKEDAKAALINEESVINEYTVENEKTHAFIEVVKPAVSLIIYGAGNDAQPLVAIADMLGWKVSIIDGRHSHATQKRFPTVEMLTVSNAENALQNIVIDTQTVFVLMTHNYNYDIEVLSQLIGTDCNYIGILGPKTKMERMYNDLSDKGFLITENIKDRIFSPVGLDLGAETSEEIALSIVSEIQSFFTGKNGKSLRLKEQQIHH